MLPMRRIEAFNQRYIVHESGCWLWQHSVSARGYGKFWYPGGATAHKFSYLLHIGPVPKDLVLDHICRVRHCVNPKHLRPITAAMNILIGEGMGAKHARQTHCLRGHPFSIENTHIITKKSGKKTRVCKICRLDRKRAYNKRNADKIRLDNRERYRTKYSPNRPKETIIPKVGNA